MKKLLVPFCAIVILFSIVGCAAPVPSGEMMRTVSNQSMDSPEMAASMDMDMAENSTAGSVGDAASSEIVDTVVLDERKLIREAYVEIEVEEIERALSQATGLSAQMGGYTMESNSWMVGEQQHIRFRFAVPVERFEDALAQTRSFGKVQSESISTRDVTAQYVDVEARIENLEATTERVRSFLEDATDVEQTLAINRELTRLEGDLNSLKGQQNVLSRQTAFSTIQLELRPVPPERTTAEVLEDATVWTPVRTFNTALATLLSVLRTLGDLSIWLIIVGGPVLIILALIWAVMRYLFSLRRRSRQPASQATPSPPPASGPE